MEQWFCLRCSCKLPCNTALCEGCWSVFPQPNGWSKDVWLKLRHVPTSAFDRLCRMMKENPFDMENVILLLPKLVNLSFKNDRQWLLGMIFAHVRSKCFVTMLLCVKHIGITIGRDLRGLLGKYLTVMNDHIRFVVNGYQIGISICNNGFFFVSAK